MATHSFRIELFSAWSFPVGLFLVAPSLLLAAVSGPGQLLEWGKALFSLLLPIVAVGYVLAPWAGRNVPVTKKPAFITGILGSLAPIITIVTAHSAADDLRLAFGMVIAWSFLAVPASFLGSLLFVGNCERYASSNLDSPA